MNTLTRYRITRYEGEAQPCAIADPAGCFYSTGEADRAISELNHQIYTRNLDILELKQTILELSDECRVAEAQTLIADMVAWFEWYVEYPSICVQEFIARGEQVSSDSIDCNQIRQNDDGGTT